VKKGEQGLGVGPKNLIKLILGLKGIQGIQGLKKGETKAIRVIKSKAYKEKQGYQVPRGDQGM